MSNITKRALISICLILGAVILLKQIKLLDWAYLRFSLSQISGVRISIILLLVLFINIGSSIRWFLLSKSAGSSLNLESHLEIYFKYGVLNYFVPGGILSEIMRINVLSNLDNNNDIGNASGIILDRIMALISQIVLLSVVLFLFFKTTITASFLTDPFSVIANILVFLTFMWLLLRILRNIIRQISHYKYGSMMISILKQMKKLILQRPLFIFILLAASVALNIGISFVLFIKISGVTDVGFRDIIIMTTASNLSSVIPVTPGGIGISEGIFSFIGSRVDNINPIVTASAYLLVRVSSIITYATVTMLFRLRKSLRN